MADRKITELPAADSTDLQNDSSLFHLVNPARVSDADKNRKLTLAQFEELTRERSISPFLLMGA